MQYFKIKEKLGYSILVQSPFKHREVSGLYNKYEEMKIIEGSISRRVPTKVFPVP